MKNPSLHRSRALATWLAFSFGGASLYAVGCGGSTKDGSSGDGGDAGEAGAPSAGKGGKGTGGVGADSGAPGSGGTAGTGKGGSGNGGSGPAGAGGSDEGGAGGGGETQGGQGGQGGEGGEGGAGPLIGATCKAIHDDTPTAASGVYVIDPDGNGGEAPYSVVCDMTTSGGGWSLGLLVNSVADGHYERFGSANVNLSTLATTPEAASATAAVAKMGWANLNSFPYADLRLTGYANGALTYSSDAIAKSTLRLQFGHDGYYLYDQGGYFWCGGTNAFTTDGVGQEDPPSGAPADCKAHTSLGDGWDFGPAIQNMGLTLCGGGSRVMTSAPASGFVAYPNAGAAQAIWVR